jgi:hypothetical protein
MTPQIIDYLEELQDLHRPAHLRFLGDNGGVINLYACIERLEADGAEPGFFADGTIHIPLSRLLSVDDHPVIAIS